MSPFFKGKRIMKIKEYKIKYETQFVDIVDNISVVVKLKLKLNNLIGPNGCEIVFIEDARHNFISNTGFNNGQIFFRRKNKKLIHPEFLSKWMEIEGFSFNTYCELEGTGISSIGVDVVSLDFLDSISTIILKEDLDSFFTRFSWDGGGGCRRWNVVMRPEEYKLLCKEIINSNANDSFVSGIHSEYKFLDLMIKLFPRTALSKSVHCIIYKTELPKTGTPLGYAFKGNAFYEIEDEIKLNEYL